MRHAPVVGNYWFYNIVLMDELARSTLLSKLVRRDKHGTKRKSKAIVRDRNVGGGDISLVDLVRVSC